MKLVEFGNHLYDCVIPITLWVLFVTSLHMSWGVFPSVMFFVLFGFSYLGPFKSRDAKPSDTASE